jgi:hypothetical protein
LQEVLSCLPYDSLWSGAYSSVVMRVTTL